MIRLHMIVHGDVQGVGFRYRAQHAANALGLTGWVRNEWDGTVEMEVQGEESAINEMFSMIARGSYISIERIEKKELPPDEEERSFHVRG